MRCRLIRACICTATIRCRVCVKLFALLCLEANLLVAGPSLLFPLLVPRFAPLDAVTLVVLLLLLGCATAELAAEDGARVVIIGI